MLVMLLIWGFVSFPLVIVGTGARLEALRPPSGHSGPQGPQGTSPPGGDPLQSPSFPPSAPGVSSFSPHGVDWGGGRGRDSQRTQASLGPGLGHHRRETFRHQEAEQGSSRAAPAGTMVGRHGRRKGMEVLPRVSQIPRLIPEKQWYLAEGTEYGGRGGGSTERRGGSVPHPSSFL